MPGLDDLLGDLQSIVSPQTQGRITNLLSQAHQAIDPSTAGPPVPPPQEDDLRKQLEAILNR